MKIGKRKIKRIVNIIKTKPKKFMLKKNQATVVLPKEQLKPVLKRRSAYYNKEYEKEKALLGWK